MQQGVRKRFSEGVVFERSPQRRGTGLDEACTPESDMDGGSVRAAQAASGAGAGFCAPSRLPVVRCVRSGSRSAPQPSPPSLVQVS